MKYLISREFFLTIGVAICLIPIFIFYSGSYQSVLTNTQNPVLNIITIVSPIGLFTSSFFSIIFYSEISQETFEYETEDLKRLTSKLGKCLIIYTLFDVLIIGTGIYRFFTTSVTSAGNYIFTLLIPIIFNVLFIVFVVRAKKITKKSYEHQKSFR